MLRKTISFKIGIKNKICSVTKQLLILENRNVFTTMQELLIKNFEEMRKNLLEELRMTEGERTQDETDQMLDSLNSIDQILKELLAQKNK